MTRNTNNLLINCDMGEWDAPHLKPIDDDIMPYIDMANIACGGHAGSKSIMAKTINSAQAHNVKIGAHPGFEDRLNFGRKYISLSSKELYETLKNQLNIFLEICSNHDVQPFHIKVHGALYHACNQNKLEANILIDVVKEICPDLVVFIAPGSLLESKANAEKIKSMAESFIDRRYNDDLTLVSRSEPDAVITDAETAKNQFYTLSDGIVVTKSGTTKTLSSDTACIHGDNPNCLQILKAIRNV